MIPRNLRIRSADRCLEIEWDSGRTDRLPFQLIRQQCPCAACVNEFTGERLLDPATVPADVHPLHADLAGNYGLKVAWSDGHHSGIFTWERLQAIAGLTADADRAAAPHG